MMKYAQYCAQHGVMRFVATLLGLRAQDMMTGAPAHFHLRCRCGENVGYA